ncbi:hypothetical protein JCM3765_003334 [Sporobolomyces pararoseus]
MLKDLNDRICVGYAALKDYRSKGPDLVGDQELAALELGDATTIRLLSRDPRISLQTVASFLNIFKEQFQLSADVVEDYEVQGLRNWGDGESEMCAKSVIQLTQVRIRFIDRKKHAGNLFAHFALQYFAAKHLPELDKLSEREVLAKMKRLSSKLEDEPFDLVRTAAKEGGTRNKGKNKSESKRSRVIETKEVVRRVGVALGRNLSPLVKPSPAEASVHEEPLEVASDSGRRKIKRRKLVPAESSSAPSNKPSPFSDTQNDVPASSKSAGETTRQTGATPGSVARASEGQGAVMEEIPFEPPSTKPRDQFLYDETFSRGGFSAFAKEKAPPEQPAYVLKRDGAPIYLNDLEAGCGPFYPVQLSDGKYALSTVAFPEDGDSVKHSMTPSFIHQAPAFHVGGIGRDIWEDGFKTCTRLITFVYKAGREYLHLLNNPIVAEWAAKPGAHLHFLGSSSCIGEMRRDLEQLNDRYRSFQPDQSDTFTVSILKAPGIVSVHSKLLVGVLDNGRGVKVVVSSCNLGKVGLGLETKDTVPENVSVESGMVLVLPHGSLLLKEILSTLDAYHQHVLIEKYILDNSSDSFSDPHVNGLAAAAIKKLESEQIKTKFARVKDERPPLLANFQDQSIELKDFSSLRPPLERTVDFRFTQKYTQARNPETGQLRLGTVHRREVRKNGTQGVAVCICGSAVEGQPSLEVSKSSTRSETVFHKLKNRFRHDASQLKITCAIKPSIGYQSAFVAGAQNSDPIVEKLSRACKSTYVDEVTSTGEIVRLYGILPLWYKNEVLAKGRELFSWTEIFDSISIYLRSSVSNSSSSSIVSDHPHHDLLLNIIRSEDTRELSSCLSIALGKDVFLCPFRNDGKPRISLCGMLPVANHQRLYPYNFRQVPVTAPFPQWKAISPECALDDRYKDAQQVYSASAQRGEARPVEGYDENGEERDGSIWHLEGDDEDYFGDEPSDDLAGKNLGTILEQILEAEIAES